MQLVFLGICVRLGDSSNVGSSLVVLCTYLLRKFMQLCKCNDERGHQTVWSSCGFVYD